MKKIILYCCFILQVTPSFALTWQDIKGVSSNDLELEGGALLYHISDLYKHVEREGNYYVKPVFVVAKNGFLAAYFKNSHSSDSFALAIRRNWFEHKYQHFSYISGYSLGLVTGYCTSGGIQMYEDCNGYTKHQVAPYGQVFFNIKKNNVSLNLSYSIAVVFVTASYYIN